MDNDTFLKEFEYFKNHPQEYKHKHAGLGFVVCFFFVLVYVIIFCVQNSTSEQALQDFLSDVSPYYILVGFITCISYLVYISIINKRVNKFDSMKYAGSVSDLFGDINHVIIKQYAPLLRADLLYRGGICGNTAFKVHSEMGTQSMINRANNKTVVDKAIDELDAAHGFKEIDIS